MTIPAGARLPPSNEPGEVVFGQAATLPNFDQIYEGHFQLVWRALRRLGVHVTQLEDAAQDVFVVVLRQLPGFEGRSSLRTWIFGITVRVASDWLRRVRRHPVEELPDSLSAKADGPLDQVARSEALSVLYQLLDELSPEQRTVFVLAEMEELALQEIATALQENVHTVKSRLHVARKSFEVALRRYHARDRWRQP